MFGDFLPALRTFKFQDLKYPIHISILLLPFTAQANLLELFHNSTPQIPQSWFTEQWPLINLGIKDAWGRRWEPMVWEQKGTKWKGLSAVVGALSPDASLPNPVMWAVLWTPYLPEPQTGPFHPPLISGLTGGPSLVPRIPLSSEKPSAASSWGAG